MTDPVLYFAFGSNLHLPQMRERCPDCELLESAVLAGYRLAFRGASRRWEAGGVATVIPDPGSRVHGLLYRLSPADLASLNGYEGVPHVYGHLPVAVTARGGARHEALTYRRNDGHGEPARPPSLRYFHQMWRSYRAHGLDESGLLAAVEESLHGGNGAGRR